MEQSRFLIALPLIFLILSEIKGATLRSTEQFQLNDSIERQESQDLLQHLEKELDHHAGKEKRCSIFKTPNLQSTLDLKIKLEEQKRANLCKFCNKLESRKNLEICKKCFNNPFNQEDDIILGSQKKMNEQKNSNETNIKFKNKLNKSNENGEEKHENLREANNTEKINDGSIVARNSIEINSNIAKSDVSALIKSASSRASLETLKTQTITGNRNTDNSPRKILGLKENNPMKLVKGTSLPGYSTDSDADLHRIRANIDENLLKQNFHHSEPNEQNLINRRLKRKKQSRKSEETTQNNKDTEFLKKQKSELLNEALIENSSKIFDVASDETFEGLDDFVELIEDITTTTTTEAPKRKILPGLKISNLRMRLANLRAKQNKKQQKTEDVITTELPSTVFTDDPKVELNLKQEKLTHNIESPRIENKKNVDDLLGETRQKRLNTGPKKIDHEILEVEENINKKLDEILQILSHNSNKPSISKEDMKIKLKNILTKKDNSEEDKDEENNLQLPLMDEIQTEEPSDEYFDSQEDVLEPIPTANLIKKLLNPTTEKNEAKEDKKSKLLLKLNIPLNAAYKNKLINKNLDMKNLLLKYETTTPQISDFSEENPNSESNNSEELYDDYDLLDLLQNSEPTAFEPKIISTRSTNTFKNIKPTYFQPTEKTLLEKENKMLSVHRNKLNELRNKIHARRQQNLFEKNINMKPEIDDEKYKNFHLTLRNNGTKNTDAKTLDESKLNLEQLLNEHLNSQERQDTELSIPKILRFTENKINLPLILLQNEDGTVEIVLDKAELCSQLNGGKCPHGEKSLCKRKTEEDLTKYPINIFNILKDTKKPTEDITKQDFYKKIINEKLFELFKSLNIDVNNSQELHSYIDDMPEKQKSELKQYLLNSLSNTQTDSNQINKDFSAKHQSTSENNRLYFKIKPDDKITSKKNHFLSDILKNLLHNQIQKELVNTNVCPSCKKNQCFCKNLDKVFFPPDYSSEYSDSESSRVLGKRQNNKIVTEDSDNSSDISPHGTVKRRYKIVHNILDWVHDVMVHNNTIV